MFDTFDYSVDMVRLYTEIKKDIFQNVMSKFHDNISYMSFCTYREMKQINAYRHNFTIKGSHAFEGEFEKMGQDHYGNLFSIEKIQDYSFWVGAEHNAKPHNSGLIDVVVEYNPNKCKDSEFLKYILKSMFLDNPYTKVKKIDFAIDIYHNIKNVILTRNTHCQYKLIDNCGDNITHYMRERGSHGHLKIYNKGREEKSNINKTRYEITLKIDIDLRYISFYEVDYGVFPNIRIRDLEQQMEFPSSVDSSSISAVDIVLTDACIDVPTRLLELPYRKRKKIEVLMNNLYRVIDFRECPYIQSTINEYFTNLLRI